MLKKIFIFSTLMTIGFLLSACATTGQHKQSASSKQTSYLYVVSGKQAYITKADNHYKVRITLTSLQQVIQFSDRPKRIVRYITGNQLKNIWKEGENSFQNDPPNTVLAAGNTSPRIIVLTKMKKHDNHVVFIFKSHSPIPLGKVQKIILMIDSSDSNCGPGTFCYTWANTPVSPI